ALADAMDTIAATTRGRVLAVQREALRLAARRTNDPRGTGGPRPSCGARPARHAGLRDPERRRPATGRREVVPDDREDRSAGRSRRARRMPRPPPPVAA